MKKIFLSVLLGVSMGAVAHADGVLEMTGPDSAVAKYNDECSNGANIVAETRAEFIKKMVENPESKLGKTLAQFTKFDGGIQESKGALTKWVQTYHMRSGCGTNHNSYTAMIQSVDTMSNSNVVVTKYIVTIDDDDESGTRTLKLKSIQPVIIRNEE